MTSNAPNRGRLHAAHPCFKTLRGIRQVLDGCPDLRGQLLQVCQVLVVSHMVCQPIFRPITNVLQRGNQGEQWPESALASSLVTRQLLQDLVDLALQLSGPHAAHSTMSYGG